MELSKRYLDQWERSGDSEIDSHVFGARKTIYLYGENKFWLLPHCYIYKNWDVSLTLWKLKM